MATAIRVTTLDRHALASAADWLAVGVAVALPWSTSATGVLIALWLVALLPTLDAAAIRRELWTTAGALPVLLWLLAALGMLWADVAWSERFDGLGGFNKLLMIPLLLAQFRRSEHGIWVFYGFFASVVGVLLVSWATALIPSLPWRGKVPGIPVREYLIQSIEFLICAFALFGYAIDDGRRRQWRAIPFLVGLAVLFLANIFFITVGRTTLLIAPALILLLGWREFGWKGVLTAGLLGAALAGALWASSPYLRLRLNYSIVEMQAYRESDAVNSTALHVEFMRKSLGFVATAPIIGHGTGSIAEEFRKVTVGEGGASSVTSVNPHNQILAVAIQIGLLGTVVLLTMWGAHFALFRGRCFAAWIGAIIVVQNVVGSLFNSHLFDFGEGWLYVFGVGVAGGMTLRERATERPIAKP